MWLLFQNTWSSLPHDAPKAQSLGLMGGREKTTKSSSADFYDVREI